MALSDPLAPGFPRLRCHISASEREDRADDFAQSFLASSTLPDVIHVIAHSNLLIKICNLRPQRLDQSRSRSDS
jgi:hypothetical protein